MFQKVALSLFFCLPLMAGANDLTLSCDGKGSMAATQTTTVNQFQPGQAGHNQMGVATTSTRRPFSGTGVVEIKMGIARMRVPDPMIPALMGGDSGGWYPIENLDISDKEITGVVHINFLSQPKFRIDRMTGTLSLSGGAGDFSGNCSAIDPNAKAKF
jgi:hypothetical protein